MSIDIASYLQDGPSDCGEDLQYDAEFIALEQAIKGKPEQQVGGTIQEAEPPNWREVKKSAEALLMRTTDLRVLIFYLRALIATESYQGLQTGLELLKNLAEQRWDTIHPQLDPDDDNDPTERINILSSLSDYETLLRPLAQLPFLESKAIGKFSFREVSVATGKSNPTSTEKTVPESNIDAAVQDTDPDILSQRLINITTSLDTLNQLENFITDQVGIGNAPSFAELRNFLKEARTFLQEWQQIKGIGQAEQPEEQVESVSEDNLTVIKATPATSVLAAINTQQDVLKALNLIIDYYKKHEPSSPIPLFLERARGLVGKNFMEVLQDIAPSGLDQAMVFKGKQDDED